MLKSTNVDLELKGTLFMTPWLYDTHPWNVDSVHNIKEFDSDINHRN